MKSARLGQLNAWLERYESAIFLLLVLAHLAPLWAFTYFPSVDGPAHLDIADMLVRYDDPQSARIREFFAINIGLAPNYLIFALLYAFMQVMPPLIAEKLLLSLYVVALPLALRYALAGIAAEAVPFSLIGFLVIYHFPLHMGFYNFSFGLVMFLITLGFWLRRRERADAGTVAGYLGLSLLCYFTHPFALAGSCLAIASTTLGELAHRWRRGDAGTRLRTLWRRFTTMALAPALGFVPAALLAAGYAVTLHGHAGISAPGGLEWPVWPRVQELLASASLASHAPGEVLVSKAFSYLLLVLIGLVVARKRESGRRADGLFVCVVGFLLLYLLVPYQVFVRWMPQRTMLYLLLVTVLWLGAQASSAIRSRALLVRPVIVIAVLLIGGAGLAVRSQKYVALNRDLAEYMSAASHVASGSTLLSLRMSPLVAGAFVSIRADLALQSGARIALRRQAIDLKILQASTRDFPLAYREGLGAIGIVASDRQFNLIPPEVDLAAYPERTGKGIDYVILWGSDEFLKPTPTGQRDREQLLQARFWRAADEYPRALARYRVLKDQLAASYELIFTSQGRGLARLYRHKGGVGRNVLPSDAAATNRQPVP